MKHLKRTVLLFAVAFVLVLNFSPVFANETETIQSTHYWRICHASWSKVDFGLPSNAPNVSAQANWAYDFDTGIESYIWSVNNATKVSLTISGAMAFPTVYAGAWRSVSADWKGSCTYTNLPIGSEPFSIPLDLE